MIKLKVGDTIGLFGGRKYEVIAKQRDTCSVIGKDGKIFEFPSFRPIDRLSREEKFVFDMTGKIPRRLHD